jgi:hypothetical protein
MSNTLWLYHIDLDKIKDVYGSKNQDLLQKIMIKNEKKYEDELMINEALDHVFFAKPMKKNEANVYGFALEQICKVLGKKVKSNILEGAGSNFLCKLKSVKPLLDRAVIPIPKNKDFPGIGYLTCEECKYISTKGFSSLHPGYATEQNELLEIIEYTAKTKKDLIGFYY